jgi:hypothetical protein
MQYKHYFNYISSQYRLQQTRALSIKKAFEFNILVIGPD